MTPKTRYRQRLKLRMALLEVFDLLHVNLNEKSIPADRTTALIAWEVIDSLMSFISRTGLKVADLPQPPDHSQVFRLKTTQKKETATRRRYRSRKASRNDKTPPDQQRGQ